MPDSAPLLVLVVPCYNEEAVMPATQEALARTLEACARDGLASPESFALYVDDGSRDATWSLIEARHAADPLCRGLRFAGNAGHQNAVMAGMEAARDMGADCVISLDADLQDDISVIPDMLRLHRDGADIVYGVRNDRSTDTRFKRSTARGFYAFMAWLGVNLVPDHADFRLVARPVLEALSFYPEHDLFLRGLFPTMGFRTARVEYRRLARQAGETKYPLAKMISFAWRGITSCSVRPLRLAGLMGAVCMAAALLCIVFSLWQHVHGQVVQGWTSLIIVILLLGSIQLLCLALMGEYVAKIFTEIRRRPRYIVRERL